MTVDEMLLDDPSPQEFIVTFPVGGVLRDCYTTVVALSEYEARLQVIAVYGRGDPEGRSGFGSVYRSRADAGVSTYGLAFIPFGAVRPSLDPELRAFHETAGDGRFHRCSDPVCCGGSDV